MVDSRVRRYLSKALPGSLYRSRETDPFSFRHLARHFVAEYTKVVPAVNTNFSDFVVTGG